MESGADGHYDNHIIVIALLALVVFVIGGLVLATAADNWGPDAVSVFDEPSIAPLPFALDHPWITSAAAALNVLVLGRAWVFVLRIETVAWLLATDRDAQRIATERAHLTAGTASREVARRRQACPNCSAAVPSEASFCDECGYRVRPATTGG